MSGVPGEPAGSGVRDGANSGSRWGQLLAIVVFLVIVVFLGIGLTLNPREIPSPLVGKPAPEFALPPVLGRSDGLSDRDLGDGEISLVNVFASWCVACRVEHPVFLDLHERGVITVHGLNYRDSPEDAAQWLDQHGNPYTRTGADVDGRAGMEWGVYGVPETFVVGADGTILDKHIGPITNEWVEHTLLPLIRKNQPAG